MKTQDYSIVVTQGDILKTFDIKGKRIKGFAEKALYNLCYEPQYISIGSRGYVFIQQEEGYFSIVNRKGKKQIDISKKMFSSGNRWYTYKNNFVTTNTKGQLVTVKRSGRISFEDLHLPKNHYFTVGHNTIITLADHILTIGANTIELPKSSYSLPSLVSVYDELYISITDKRTMQVYLFDRDGVLFPNFPVYGSSKICLANMDQDRAIEFIVQGKPNTLIQYQIN